MYRLLTILISFLFTAHAMRASVAIPYVFVKNYTVDDYKASCQNWGLFADTRRYAVCRQQFRPACFRRQHMETIFAAGTGRGDRRNELQRHDLHPQRDDVGKLDIRQRRNPPLPPVGHGPAKSASLHPLLKYLLLYRKKYRMHSRVPSLPTERSFSSEPSHKDYISQTPTVRSCNTCLYRTNYKTISSALSAYRTTGKSGWRSTTDYHKSLSILRSLC